VNPPRPEDWEGPFVVAALICGRLDEAPESGSFDLLDVRERFELPLEGPLRLAGRKLLLRLSRGGLPAAKITTRLVGPDQYFGHSRVAKVAFTDDVAQTVSVVFDLDDIELPYAGHYGFLVRSTTGSVLTWVPFLVSAHKGLGR